jgi:hypothetical protein
LPARKRFRQKKHPKILDNLPIFDGMNVSGIGRQAWDLERIWDGTIVPVCPFGPGVGIAIGIGLGFWISTPIAIPMDTVIALPFVQESQVSCHCEELQLRMESAMWDSEESFAFSAGEILKREQ